MLQCDDELPAGQRQVLETMVSVERCSQLVLRIDHEGEHADFRAYGSHQRIGKKCSAELASLISEIHREAPEPCDWHGRIARQQFDQGVGEPRQQHTSGGERVITCDPSTVAVDSHIARTDPSVNVLPCLMRQVAIESLVPTREIAANMSRPQTLDSEWRCHFASSRRFLRSSSARSMAGTSGGGFTKRSTKRR